MPVIKAKRLGDVKPRRMHLFAVLAAVGSILTGLCAHAEELPDIEAKSYDVSVVRHSKSGKVYLFNDTQKAKPPVGRILLLKQGSTPAMAFRVLKSYPDSGQFAGTRVRTYPGKTELAPGENFAALEKITDFIPPPPTEAEKADLEELEGASAASKSASGEYREDEVLPYDPELDAGSSPPPGGVATDPEAADHEEDEDSDDDKISVEEIEPLDTDLNWLTFTLGFIRNTPPAPLSSGYFTGGGIRYAYTIKKTPYFRKAKLQDSIALEGSIFYYQVSNLTESLSDAYTIVPIIGTIRYNLLVSESLGVFVYAGIGKNNVVASTGPDSPASAVEDFETSRDALGSIFPAFGAGFTYRIGPSWDARFDLGFDVISGGLMLRF